MKTNLKRYTSFILGLIIIAITFNLFFLKFRIIAGGISGLSIISHQLYNINIVNFLLISNIVVLLVSYILLGKEITDKALIASFLLPVFIKIFNPIINIVDFKNLELIIIAIMGGIATGIGYGLVTKEGYSTGGNDLVGEIISKYFNISIGRALSIFDGIIILSSWLIFGFESMIYAFVAYMTLTIISNKIILGSNDSKTFFIVTTKFNEIKAYILEVEKQDVTIFDAIGGYNNQKTKVLMSVLKTRDYYRIKTGIEAIDPNVFITITDSYESINSNLSISGVKKKRKKKKTT